MNIKLMNKAVDGDNLYLTIQLADPGYAPIGYTLGPFSVATFQALTPVQRRQAIVAAARQVLIPSAPPDLGLSIGDSIDIGS